MDEATGGAEDFDERARGRSVLEVDLGGVADGVVGKVLAERTETLDGDPRHECRIRVWKQKRRPVWSGVSVPVVESTTLGARGADRAS
jgi:hypothetical protein